MAVVAHTQFDRKKPPPPSDRRRRPAPATVPDLSFVIPAYNEEGNIEEIVARVAREATRLVNTFEIIVVDDGSRDGTFATAKMTSAKFPVRVIRLSRNFGKEQAIMAGLERTIGAAVVVLDADLQEPVSYLEQMLKHYRDGYEMVYAVRAHRDDEPYLKRAMTKVFYRLLSYGTDVTIPADARDFRLMDRAVVDALCGLPERNRFMKGLYGWVGFRSKGIPVLLEERENGASKFGFRKLISLGLTGLTSFTDWPLRVWTGLGTVFALISIIYGFVIIAKTLLWGTDLPGWSTIAVAIFFLGGLQLMSIGILGEYLARVFTEVKGRPGFIVAEDISPPSEDK